MFGEKESHPPSPKSEMLNSCRDSFPLAGHQLASVFDFNLVKGVVMTAIKWKDGRSLLECQPFSDHRGEMTDSKICRGSHSIIWLIVIARLLQCTSDDSCG